jgi:hypothetical protein
VHTSARQQIREQQQRDQQEEQQILQAVDNDPITTDRTVAKIVIIV